jgi:multicomponent Na+:H+ antiporter subunit B
MAHDPILRVVTKLLVPLILLFALYVQFHGDYGPGGGFQAGVIFAAAFILYGLVFDLGRLARVLPASVLLFLAPLGVLLYAGVGVAGLLLGGNYLDYNVLAHDPKEGQHLGILLVELGVGMTVFSVMVLLFQAFAARGRRA